MKIWVYTFNIKGIRDVGYVNPTLIQKQSIPSILAGHDVVGSAETGTGKTAGFVLPMLQILDRSIVTLSFQTRSIILCPTRELADQIYKSVLSHGKFLSLKTTVVYGGVSINPQKKILRTELYFDTRADFWIYRIKMLLT